MLFITSLRHKVRRDTLMIFLILNGSDVYVCVFWSNIAVIYGLASTSLLVLFFYESPKLTNSLTLIPRHLGTDYPQLKQHLQVLLLYFRNKLFHIYQLDHSEG